MDKKRWATIAVGVVVAAGLVTGAFALGRNIIDTDPEPQPSPPATQEQSPTPSPTPTIPEDFRVVEDEDAGFTIAYPEGWDRYQTPRDQEVRLLASPNRRHYVQVRVQDIGVTFTEDTLPQAKQITDEALSAVKGIEFVTAPDAVAIGGLPAWFYLYEFKDKGSGKKAVHAHYFVFGEERMFVIVFQALPLRSFGDLAPTFDEILATFGPLPAGG